MTAVIPHTECQDYELPENVAAPEGFDPDVEAFSDPPIGRHRFVIEGYDVAADHEFRIKGDTYILDQLRPKLRIPAGQPFAGASVMDFLPLPTGAMHQILANKWGQFIKRAGFQLKPGQLKPEGFKLGQIIGREIAADIEQQTDAAGQPKFKANGEPLVGVKFFGYDYPDTVGKQASPGQSAKNKATPAGGAKGGTNGEPATAQTEQAAAAPAKPNENFDL